MTSQPGDRNRGGGEDSPLKQVWAKVKEAFSGGGTSREQEQRASKAPSTAAREERVDPLGGVADEERTDVREVGRRLEDKRHTALDGVDEDRLSDERVESGASSGAAQARTAADSGAAAGEPGEATGAARVEASGTAGVAEVEAGGVGGAAPLIPDEPADGPSEPAERPSEPADGPSGPARRPSEPADEPSEPAEGTEAGSRTSSDYESMTVEELRELATERDITGRWEMTKAELIAALSGEPGGDEAYAEMTVDELRQIATDRDITGRWEMTKDELIAALRRTPN